MIQGITHLAFMVRDMEKSLRFYCDVLGLEKAFELHNDLGEPWIIYLKVAEGQFIELFYGGEEPVPQDFNASGYNHLCLQVRDVQAIASKVKSAGIELDVEVQQGKDLNYQCWIRDPDGNRIEFMQLHPDSPQMKGAEHN